MQDMAVIITGGSSGIGRAAALKWAQQGANVLITGRHANALEKVAAHNDRIEPLIADSADPASAETIISKALDCWGKLDVLVNNAGAGFMAPLETISTSQIEAVMAINVTAPSLLSAAAIPHLKATRGSIINITSTIGHKPVAGLSHYGASKAALEYLTRAWALELAPDIRVNAIAPGPTASGALTGMMGLSAEQAAAVEAQEREIIPLKRRGEPEEVADWIVWLAGSSSGWVTGQVIGVDGGFGLH